VSRKTGRFNAGVRTAIVVRTNRRAGKPRVSPYNSAALLGKFVKSNALATPSDRKLQSDPWADDADEPTKSLTRDEAGALVAAMPQRVSPWWVIAVQAAVGVLAATVWGLLGTAEGLFGSALYGAAVVVVPGALMARGMTRPLQNVSPVGSAASVMLWSLVKMGVSIVMLMLAAKLVQPLSWPALLATMVLCMLVYWFALLRRKH
jgi:ATP synthase protein I